MSHISSSLGCYDKGSESLLAMSRTRVTVNERSALATHKESFDDVTECLSKPFWGHDHWLLAARSSTDR